MIPETCPFCGAGQSSLGFDGRYFKAYGCGTTISHHQNPERMRSRDCRIAERDGLKTRVAELERDLEQAKADRARAAMDARNPLLARVAEIEARCKQLETAARAVYIDCVASGARWSKRKTKHMLALRDVLEAKP